MTLLNLIQWSEQQLKAPYQGEAKSEAWSVLSAVLKQSVPELMSQPDRKIENKDLESIQVAVRRRSAGTRSPLARPAPSASGIPATGRK